MRQSLRSLFGDAMKQISEVFDIEARTTEIRKDEEEKGIARAQTGTRENPYWTNLRIFSRTVAANFVWPILTPLFVVLIKLPMQILYNAAMTLKDMVIGLFSRTQAHKNNQSAQEAPSALKKNKPKSNNSNLLSFIYGNSISNKDTIDSNHTPCIFYVDIISDGIGDLYHYMDALAVLKTEELENSYFVIKSNREGSKDKQQILSIINSLPSNHPLIKYKEKLSISFDSSSEREIALLIKEKIGANYSVLFMSSRNFFTGSFEKINFDYNNCNYDYIYEHGGRAKGLMGAQDIWPSHSMGVGKGDLGIFTDTEAMQKNIPDLSSIRKSVLEKININIDDSTTLNIMYSHIHTETAIKNLLSLHKTDPLTKDKRLILFCPKGIPDVSDECKSLLDNNNCEIVVAEGWVDDATFINLKILESKTSNFAMASGDKSTEHCINNNLFPIIEFKAIEKANFWTGFVDMLNDLKSNKSLKDDINEINKIIDYINASIDFFEMKIIATEDKSTERQSLVDEAEIKLLKAIDELNQDCFKVWDMVCAHVRDNHSIDRNLSNRVKILRASSDGYKSNYAKKVIFEMSDNEYLLLIHKHINNIIGTLGIDYPYYLIKNCSNNNKEAQNLLKLMEIRPFTVNEPLHKIIINYIKILSNHDGNATNIYNFIVYPSIETILELNTEDLTVFKEMFANMLDHFKVQKSSEILDNLTCFLDALKKPISDEISSKLSILRDLPQSENGGLQCKLNLISSKVNDCIPLNRIKPR